jgi:hypothetical protein
MDIRRMSDVDTTELEPYIAVALERVISKYYQYQERLEYQKAHGCAVAIKIFYESICGDFSDTIPTQRGDL